MSPPATDPSSTPLKDLPPAPTPKSAAAPPTMEQDQMVKRTRMEQGEVAAQKATEPPHEHESISADHDSVMNPREVRRLPKRTPPGPYSKETYPWPDPLLPPTHMLEDPHIRRSRSGDPPIEIPTSHTAYTDTEYKCQFIPFEKILGNLAEEQANLVKASSQSTLVVQTYGGGNLLYRS